MVNLDFYRKNSLTCVGKTFRPRYCWRSYMWWSLQFYARLEIINFYWVNPYHVPGKWSCDPSSNLPLRFAANLPIARRVLGNHFLMNNYLLPINLTACGVAVSNKTNKAFTRSKKGWFPQLLSRPNVIALDPSC